MPPSKWEEEEDETSSEEESSPASSPPPAIVRRSKFADEEEEEVLDSWDAAEDSEVEREKAKKAAEAKAKAEAEAKANHKTKSQRIEEKRQENLRRRQAEEEESSEDEDEATKRARLRRTEKDSDMIHAEDLFGDLSVSARRSGGKPVTLQDADDPNNSINLSALPLFNPTGKEQFARLRETLIPLITANSKKPQYSLFIQELAKQLAKDMPSDQIKKVASGLTTLSNERMKEEKAAEKGGKKTKAAKTKSSLVATRDVAFKADTSAYDDGLGDDDFM